MCLRLVSWGEGSHDVAVAGYENGGLSFWDLRTMTMAFHTKLAQETGMYPQQAIRLKTRWVDRQGPSYLPANRIDQTQSRELGVS